MANDDIKRSGLKAYVMWNSFDNYLANKDALYAPTWTKLIADAIIGGHLKLNGSVESYGIEAPIAIGDNLELDGVVYHIEALTHTAQLSPNGPKQFRTSLDLSHGVDLNSENNVKIFAQMRNESMNLENKEDQQFDSVLPNIASNSIVNGEDQGNRPLKDVNDKNQAFSSGTKENAVLPRKGAAVKGQKGAI
jgi:hypothetical protein